MNHTRRLTSSLSILLPTLFAGWVVAVGCGGEAEAIPAASADGGDTDATTGATKDGAPTTNEDAGGTQIRDAAARDANIDAPEVDLTFGTCPDFTACGGNVVGEWKMTGGCISDSLLDQAEQYCTGFAVKSSAVKGKGILNATATNIARKFLVTADLSVSAPCPGTIALVGGCAGLASTILGLNDAITSASCTPATVGCDCDIKAEFFQENAAPYTTNGNTLTSGEVYDYCVAGSELGLKPQDQQLPITIELAK